MAESITFFFSGTGIEGFSVGGQFCLWIGYGSVMLEFLIALYLVVAVYWLLVDRLTKLLTRGYGVLGVRFNEQAGLSYRYVPCFYFMVIMVIFLFPCKQKINLLNQLCVIWDGSQLMVLPIVQLHMLCFIYQHFMLPLLLTG